MPNVLERLRVMEIDILSRLTVGAGQHVGSIKIVKGKGKGLEDRTRDLANLFKGKSNDTPVETSHTHVENVDEMEYDTDEEEVFKLMEGANADGRPGKDVTTYRTARWEEPKETVMSLFANPPSKFVKSLGSSPD